MAAGIIIIATVRGRLCADRKATTGMRALRNRLFPRCYGCRKSRPVAVFLVCGAMTGQTGNIFSRKRIFHKLKCLMQAVPLSTKITQKITGYCRSKRLIRTSRFTQRKSIFPCMKITGMDRIMTGRVAGCRRATRPWSTSGAGSVRWGRCAIATWGAFST